MSAAVARWWWIGAVVLVAAVACVAAAQASAHDHLVPRTVLMKGKQELLTGRRIIEYSWTRPSGDGLCVTAQALLTSGFRAADSVAPGSELRIRILKSQRPGSFTLEQVDREGAPIRQMNVRLEPVVRSGQTVAWDAFFRVNRPGTDYRLQSEGHWRDRQGCDADQFAFWSFHIKTRGS